MIKIKTFPQGGVHPHEHKISKDKKIEFLSLPETVSIPLSQHIGAPAESLVQPNDKVKVGQLIAKATGFVSANIHSSVSGTVQKIEPVMDVSGYKKPAIIIKVEGDDWQDSIDKTIAIKREITATSEEIKQKIQESGIVGLGGATFPSHIKLSIPAGKKLEYLIINGVECEPFLTSDHRLMLEKAEEIFIGIQLLLKALGIKKTLIGIENNKKDAIAIFEKLSQHYSDIKIFALKTQYPQGGERQLVKALTTREIPPAPKGLPIDVGCIVQNVGTVYAIYEAVQKNKPLFERVVCVTGKTLLHPSNYLVRIGTPIRKLLETAGGLPDNAGKVICGGPMMGKALPHLDIPVTKGTSGVVVIPENEAKRPEVLNCVHCAKCVSSCPLGLEPYLLMALIERKYFDKAEDERILSCCECACCVFICPSNRPLLDHIRIGKQKVLENIKSRDKK